jgi:hypothetical protein
MADPTRAPGGAAAGAEERAMTACLLVTMALLLAPAAPAPTVDEIVARHVTARGGKEALAALRTVRMTGRAIEGPGREAIVRREVARPGRIRTEFVFQGTTGVYAWDGTSGWRVSPLDGVLDAQPMTPVDAAIAAEQADLDGPLVDWKAKGHRVERVGTDALPGGPAYHLKVTLASGPVRHVWVDAQSALVVQTETTRVLRGHETALRTEFGDYRPTAGVLFPRRLETAVPGRPRRLRILVENVEVNVPLDEARFKLAR